MDFIKFFFDFLKSWFARMSQIRFTIEKKITELACFPKQCENKIFIFFGKS
jgi:hypothetical protein